MPPRRRRIRLVLLRFAGMLVALAGGVAAIDRVATGPAGEGVPAGVVRCEARYLMMRDGVRIAVDRWVPADLAPEVRVPTLIRSTRYVRTLEFGPVGKVLAVLGLMPWVDEEVSWANDAGYALVLVDARGSGASFGTRDAEWSPEEVADLGEFVDWIVAQPWSNGRVGGFGVSYDGNTAELLAATGRPAVRAVAPLYDDYDPIFTQVMAGGAFARPFLTGWGAYDRASDEDDLCAALSTTGWRCLALQLVVRGTKPVDGADGRALLADAVAGHAGNYDVVATWADVVYPREPRFPDGTPNRTVSPYEPAVRAAVEANGVAMWVRLGWYDAGTVNPGLVRAMVQTNPIVTEIGPWGHGGEHHVDPFLPAETPTTPSVEAQGRALLAFFDGYLKPGEERPIRSDVRYWTMNGGGWRTTATWPPTDVQPVTWYLTGEHGLRQVPDAPGTDLYAVDFAASTGHPSRWDTQLGAGDVVYPDRATEDLRLLTYTSEPLPADALITGAPVITLQVSSTASDGLFFAYLEDVAPDGRVTYLTEGVLRALHRRVSERPPPRPELGPVHSFLAADGLPLIPGEPTEVAFALYAVSVRIAAGHRLRVALAGADAAAFDRVPADEIPTITVYRGEGSSIVVPTVLPAG